MRKLSYTFWQEDEFFIGFLNDYPEYQTQSFSKDELIENLKSLVTDIESGKIPFIKKVEELALV